MRVMITVPDLAEQAHWGTDTIYQMARREDAPLPLRYLPGDRYGRISVFELDEWWRDNAVLAADLARQGKATG